MKKTILLADDSVTIRKVVELTFMDESFELVSVGNGTEALDSFDAATDLVIADVHMPGADGYEVCAKVKESSPSTPVLLLVGTFESFDEKLAEQAGADGHLKKPFDSQDLLGRVRDLLSQSEATGAEVGSEPEAAEAPSEQAVFDAAPEAPEAPEAPPAPAADDAGEDPVAVQATPAAPTGDSSGGSQNVMSEESIDRIARRVVELLSEEALREVAWEVIPDLAEVVIKERLAELESQAE